MSGKQTPIARLQLEDMVHHLQCLRRSFGAAVRPIPEGIWDSHAVIDQRTGLHELREADCRRFPVELSSVLRGNDLYAYFDCYAHLRASRPVRTRMTIDDVSRAAESLRGGKHTPVTEWNLLQLNAAQSFADLIATDRTGVPYHLIETFQRGQPHALRTALDEYAPLFG